MTVGTAAALSTTDPSPALQSASEADQATAFEAPPVGEAPWQLLRPLALGSTLASGWTVAALSGAAQGSCVVTLRNERGRNHRIHICRNGGEPQGLVYTDHFDLLVMNGGQGDLPTEEGLAQAVAELAHVLAANHAAATPLVNDLLSHAERVDRFAATGKLL
ncbi:MAG: hypothetical protein SF182_12445 [Deltaproteobacteria bacterium]|nr:hypothetical protein [Deltaproteobacteria bacterium]